MTKPSKPTKTVPDFLKGRDVLTVLPVTARCYVCGKMIAEGAEAIHRWSRGNRHPTCEDPDGR